MDKSQWKTEIEMQIKYDHEYIPSFQTTIMILAEILEERDRTYQTYIETGAQPVVNFTSDRGAVNLKQNPLLKTWQELNTAALAYLRDLGLTAAGLRKLQGQIPKEEVKRDDFALIDKPWDEGMSEEEKQFFTADGTLIDYHGWSEWKELHDD